MRAFKTLRDFLELLETDKQLLRITDAVSLEPDLAAAGRAVNQAGGETSPALLFNNIKGFRQSRSGHECTWFLAQSRKDPLYEALYLGIPWTELDYMCAVNTSAPLHVQLYGALSARGGRPMRRRAFISSIGNEPIIAVCAAMEILYDQSEYKIAAVLQGSDYPVVKSAKGLDVPWGSQYVLEGRILARQREIEGPFGEFPGQELRVLLVPVLACARTSATVARCMKGITAPGALDRTLLCRSRTRRAGNSTGGA